MGVKSVQRGKNLEYRVVHLARQFNLPAFRVPVSGAGAVKGDVVIAGATYECKYRSSGFEGIYALFEEAQKAGCPRLIICGRRKRPLVVLALDDFLRLLGGREHEAVGS